MFSMGLGTSICSLNKGLIHEFIDDLADSSIATFELDCGVFPCDFDNALKDHFIRMLHATGKKAMSYHFPFSTYTNDDLSAIDETSRKYALSRFKAALREAFSFGCKFMVIHSMLGPVLPGTLPARYDALHRSLEELEFDLELLDMYIAIEYLPGNNVESLRKRWEGHSDRIGCCLDVNHVGDQYSNLPRIVHELGPKLLTTHISTCNGIKEEHLMPLPGKEGVVPWGGLFTALEEIDYQGPFNFETHINVNIEFADRIREMEMCYNSLLEKYYTPLKNKQ